MKPSCLITLCCISLATCYRPIYQGSVGFNCNSALTAYSVSGYYVSPWPPTYGSSLAVNMTGVMNSDQQVSAWVFTVKLGATLLESGNVPEQVSVAQGQVFNASAVGYIPTFDSPGNYSVTSQLQSSNGQYLNCWQFNFQLT